MNTEFRFLPDQASSLAAEVDALYGFLLAVSGVITICIAFLVMFFAIRYRRGSPADRTLGSSNFFLIEVSWIVIPLILVMIMFYWGARLYFRQTRAPADAMTITCVGRQWMWKFQHPEGNSEINHLHVPLGQPIRLQMISEDVIHSVYIPAFRMKQDVLPGRYTSLWFEPTKAGTYHLFCAEYCGAKHSEMRGYVHVLEPGAYQQWLSGRLSDAEALAATETGSLFEQFRCNTCHAGGGQTSRGPALQNVYGSTVVLQSGKTVIADDTYLRESILRPAAKVVAGYQPIMPSYEGQIGEEGILRLIAEIKAMSSGNTPTDGRKNNGASTDDSAP